MRYVVGFLMFLVGILGFASYAASFGDIQVQFCNDTNITKELDLVARAGETIPLCVQFTNTSKFSVRLGIDRLDSVVTEDVSAQRACNAADRPKVSFGNFVQSYDADVSLAPGQTIEKTYTVRYPIGFQGLSHGCLAYHLLDDTSRMQTENTNFSVMVRSVKFVDVYVGETQVRSSLFLSSFPKLVPEESRYRLQFALTNDGNIDQKVSFSGYVTNFLGYEELIVQRDTDITAQQEIQYLSSETYTLPSYKGLFWMHIDVAYTPTFNFDVTSTQTSSVVPVAGIISFGRVVMLGMWQIALIGILLLFVLYMVYRIFKGRRKIVNGL